MTAERGMAAESRLDLQRSKQPDVWCGEALCAGFVWSFCDRFMPLCWEIPVHFGAQNISEFRLWGNRRSGYVWRPIRSEIIVLG